MTAPPLDPYTILGVTVEASDDDLDHAFRGLVRELHPDTRTAQAHTESDIDADTESDIDADRRLRELLNAYATLRDPIRRAAYDQALVRKAAPGATSPPPRSPAVPPDSTPIWVDPAIRVGPVRWEPPPQVTPVAASDAISRRGGKHNDTR